MMSESPGSSTWEFPFRTFDDLPLEVNSVDSETSLGQLNGRRLADMAQPNDQDCVFVVHLLLAFKSS